MQGTKQLLYTYLFIHFHKSTKKSTHLRQIANSTSENQKFFVAYVFSKPDQIFVPLVGLLNLKAYFKNSIIICELMCSIIPSRNVQTQQAQSQKYGYVILTNPKEMKSLKSQLVTEFATSCNAHA